MNEIDFVRIATDYYAKTKAKAKHVVVRGEEITVFIIPSKAKLERPYAALGGQQVRDVILIAEARKSQETFEFFERVFSAVAAEIREVEQTGIEIQGRTITVLPVFNCDLKATYAMSGLKGVVSKYPCPLCSVKLNQLSWLPEKIAEDPFLSRPNIEDLRNKPASEYQKSNTFNLFNLRLTSTNESSQNILPPILHIRLGFGNKLIELFDNVVEVWAKEHPEFHLAKLLLAESLGNLGAYRKDYYSGMISGGQCHKLMMSLGEFCDSFFHIEVGLLPSIASVVQNANILEEGLRKLSNVYSGMDGMPGFGYYLSSQNEWSGPMKDHWGMVCAQFIRIFKKTISRPRKKANATNEDTNTEEPAKWRVPLQMPKLHLVAAHIVETVELYGPVGALSEQSFEHFQATSLTNRETHSRNQCEGVQIAEDLIMAWLKSSPEVHNVLHQLESNRIADRCYIKKNKYDM